MGIFIFIAGCGCGALLTIASLYRHFFGGMSSQELRELSAFIKEFNRALVSDKGASLNSIAARALAYERQNVVDNHLRGGGRA